MILSPSDSAPKARVLDDWIVAYLQYSDNAEAPKKLRFWAAVSAIAGALRKKVWFDMGHFRWSPTFYIVLVAPPGIVAKSTTVDIAMNFLRAVPGIKFGPDAVTWPALVQHFAAASESFEWAGEWHPMSAITLVATEFGNLVNMQDREMISLLITLWDERKRYDKETKTSGNDTIESPWLNLIACTTPHWIAENVPPSMIGGGLSSRCIFVYADQKEKYVAYPKKFMGNGSDLLRQGLQHDLEYIASQLVGPFTLAPEAEVWGEAWYEDFWKKASERMDSQMLEGYAARKQAHLHRVAMILSVSRGDTLRIEQNDLEVANIVLEELEPDMQKVFSRIGRSEVSLHAERFAQLLGQKGSMTFEDAYRAFHFYFPDARDFEAIVAGLQKSGQIKINMTTAGVKLEAVK